MSQSSSLQIEKHMPSANPSAELIRQAANLLHAGRLVSFPTETVYGLGADATNREALKALYSAKGRPASHPVIVHVDSLAAIENWAVDIPDCLFTLAEEFWPGPLTVVLKRAKGVLDELTGGQTTVALRIPSHPIALALLREFGGGVAAPSANKFGRLSPTSHQDVLDEFGDEVSLVLDGGACEVGIESTILDLTVKVPRILRPGMLSEVELAYFIDSTRENKLHSSSTTVKTAAEGFSKDGQDIRVPGALPSHYAPKTPIQLIEPDYMASVVQEHKAKSLKISVVSFKSQIAGFSADDWITLPAQPQEYARRIYRTLRHLDRREGDIIVVESPPQNEFSWSGINDRLNRAAHRP